MESILDQINSAQALFTSVSSSLTSAECNMLQNQLDQFAAVIQTVVEFSTEVKQMCGKNYRGRERMYRMLDIVYEGRSQGGSNRPRERALCATRLKVLRSVDHMLLVFITMTYCERDLERMSDVQFKYICRANDLLQKLPPPQDWLKHHEVTQMLQQYNARNCEAYVALKGARDKSDQPPVTAQDEPLTKASHDPQQEPGRGRCLQSLKKVPQKSRKISKLSRFPGKGSTQQKDVDHNIPRAAQATAQQTPGKFQEATAEKHGLKQSNQHGLAHKRRKSLEGIFDVPEPATDVTSATRQNPYSIYTLLNKDGDAPTSKPSIAYSLGGQ
ncbi:hypothetical protein BJ878DRAFT_503560 [Calycina marina]|uniref:Uncharacterized protein n=1 Tax=Calycina marina TaxID=1763456 RepID=A0A9P7Z438_9HELO|nr:hypothetical protein BJ878DRAFT_503560 [Calycina marina]